MSDNESKQATAQQILTALGLPRAQQNERSSLCLLALLDLRPAGAWADAKAPLIGITPIMDWARQYYDKEWAPNTRETIRRQSMHQFVDAGICLRNPDDPSRAVNSPHTVYQIAPDTLALLKTFETPKWHDNLAGWLVSRQTLVAQYAKEREQVLVPVQIAEGHVINLSPGAHSELIRDIIEDFARRFAPGALLMYAGDTGEKLGYFDAPMLAKLGVTVDTHGKMPDVILYDGNRNWLLLVESVTSHGPVDGKRHAELMKLFAGSTAGLVYVTAFPSRSYMAKYLATIAWETEVWCADAPSHLIHFNGVRFLGPYA